MTLQMLKQETYNIGFAAGEEQGRCEGIAIGEKLGEERGRNEGISLGITQGEKKAKLETAKVLKAANVSLNLIVDSTGLSPEEIEKL